MVSLIKKLKFKRHLHIGLRQLTHFTQNICLYFLAHIPILKAIYKAEIAKLNVIKCQFGNKEKDNLKIAFGHNNHTLKIAYASANVFYYRM